MNPIGTYCYHAEQPGYYGDVWLWQEGYRGFLERNRWYCVEQYVKLNKKVPPEVLVSLNQITIITGMLIVSIVNWLIAEQAPGEEWNVALGWRWMFASEGLPALLLLVLLFFVPESPRWPIVHGGRRDSPLHGGPMPLRRVHPPPGLRRGEGEVRVEEV